MYKKPLSIKIPNTISSGNPSTVRKGEEKTESTDPNPRLLRHENDALWDTYLVGKRAWQKIHTIFYNTFVVSLRNFQYKSQKISSAFPGFRLGHFYILYKNASVHFDNKMLIA